MDNAKHKNLGYIGFKPYYNWNTFNTNLGELVGPAIKVLNLIITGIPSILTGRITEAINEAKVLNLIITGIPSILLQTAKKKLSD